MKTPIETTPEEVRRIVREGLALLADRYTSDRAEILLTAIAYQESAFIHRRQIKGPARGLWQFELGGGVWGVMNHRTTKEAARELCQLCDVNFEAKAIYAALEFNDNLACGFARLLLWTDSRPMPTDEVDSWNYYIRNWRPGKPHLERWAANWAKAIDIWKN